MMAWVRKHGGAIYLTALIITATSGAYWLAIHNAASVTQLCRAGNEARAQQVILWEHILRIARAPAHETPAHARDRLATERAFEAYVHKVFAPRDCSKPLTVGH